MALKRGQVTLFVIVGFLILILFIGWLVFFQSRTAKQLQDEQEQLISSDTAAVKLYVEQCFRNALKEAVVIIGAQGGYATDPPTMFLLPLPGLGNTLALPLYGPEAIPAILSREQLEHQVAIVFRGRAESCFDPSYLSSFPFDIQPGQEWIVDILVNPGRIDARVNRLLRIKSGSHSTTMDTFLVEISSPLEEMHTAARKILQESSCLSCLPEILPDEFTVDETVFLLGDKVVSVRTIQSNDLVYNFAETLPLVEPMDRFPGDSHEE